MTRNKTGRPLSPGELALARSIFGGAIDYARVRVHERKWWPFHLRNWIMAPDGALWLHPQGPLAGVDFAKAGIGLQGLFIHEMTHVWQYQQGLCLVLRRHPFCRYDYAIRPGWPLEKYGIEQQAEIVRHAFLLRNAAHVRGAPPLAQYETILPF